MQPIGDDIVYGRWSVKEAILSGRVTKVYIAQGAHGAPIDEIFAMAKERKIPFHLVDRFRMEQLVRGNHQGVAAQVTALTLKSLDEVIQKALDTNKNGARILFLDGVQDPQNVGSILRSAAFFGVPGVVVPKWRSSALTSSVISASAGAAQFVDLAQVANLAQAMEVAKARGIWLIGADMAGEDVKHAKLPTPFGLVLGSEGEGLRQLTLKKCDGIVSIGKTGSCPGLDSLNVGCACSILLHTLG
jgi:23S rRNA (guanosine2251-2'-O)-methyltransferase